MFLQIIVLTQNKFFRVVFRFSFDRAFVRPTGLALASKDVELSEFLVVKLNGHRRKLNPHEFNQFSELKAHLQIFV